MVYKNLSFSKIDRRPFFYTNFVSTIDGKIQVISDPKAYWPIGSKIDHETLVYLRSCSDVLIHGKNTAKWYRTLDSLAKEKFQHMRKEQGKENLLYTIFSNNPDDSLIPFLQNPADSVKTLLVTNKIAKISKELEQTVLVARFGQTSVDLLSFSKYLYENGSKYVLLEGGPHLMAAFFKAGLVDEIFLTIAPKVFGNDGSSLTMVEGLLLPPHKVPRFKLISSKQVKDELYLRYRTERD